ncbi:MFS general substrate transporter [Acephala macrosclerotiorum]|nr:MFS general substrate transporter [Acephala macrosclerotiorum]
MTSTEYNEDISVARVFEDGSLSIAVDENYLNPKELSPSQQLSASQPFMIAIDGGILATAIPRITSDFHNLNDVGWYGSAYLLTEMAFQPTFGRIYTFFDARITYLVSIVIFGVGSIVCAAAPNSSALIIGRAISGAGAAGLLCGSLLIYGRSVPLRKRPLGLTLVTSMYRIAGLIRPTLGSVITDIPRLTWRFPAGAITFAIACKTFNTRSPRFGHLPLWEKLTKLDITSGFLLIVGLVLLLIAFQWGGSTYACRPGTNTATSGVRGLPYGILASTAIIITRFSMTWKGYYVPFMWLGASIFIAGACLLRTLNVSSSMGHWVGYQILTGLGCQVVLPDADMPTACALVNVFLESLKTQLGRIDGANVAAVASAGASEIVMAVEPSLLPAVRVAFNSAIMKTFIIPIAVGRIGLLLSFGMERRIEDEKPSGQEQDEGLGTDSPAQQFLHFAKEL